MKNKLICLVLSIGMILSMNLTTFAMTTVERGEVIGERSMPEENILYNQNGYRGATDINNDIIWTKFPNGQLSDEESFIQQHSLKIDFTAEPNAASNLSAIAGTTIALDYPDEFSNYYDYDAYKVTCYVKVVGELNDSSVFILPVGGNVLEKRFFEFDKNTKDINSGKWIECITYITKSDFKREATAYFAFQIFSLKGSETEPVYMYLNGLSLAPCYSSEINDLNEVKTVAPDNAASPAPDYAPKNIVCIGDSLTQGCGANDPDRYFTSYRYPLWKKLIDEGIDFDFVKPEANDALSLTDDYSFSNNFNGNCANEDYKGQHYNNNHMARFGIKLSKVVQDWKRQIDSTDFDMALVLLGTNDRGEADSKIKENMGKLVDMLRDKNPKTHIYLLGLPDDYPFQVNIDIKSAVKDKDTVDSPVTYVDTTINWIENPKSPNTDTLDWLHPNAQGDEKIAAAVFNAIKSYITGDTSTATPILTPTRTPAATPSPTPTEVPVIYHEGFETIQSVREFAGYGSFLNDPNLIKVSDEESHTGMKSLKFAKDWNSIGTQGKGNAEEVEFKPNTNYMLSLWVKGNFYKLSLFSPSDTQDHTESIYAIEDGINFDTWNKINIPFSVGQRTTMAVGSSSIVRDKPFEIEIQNAYDVMYIDDITITELSDPIETPDSQITDSPSPDITPDVPVTQTPSATLQPQITDSPTPDVPVIQTPSATLRPQISDSPTPEATASQLPSITPGSETTVNQIAYVPVSKTAIVKVTGTVKTASKVTVYKKAATNKGKWTTVAKNKKITVKSVSGSYAKVTIKVKGKKKTGYVKVSSLKFGKNQTGKVTANTKTYKAAATNKGYYTSLAKNKKFTISGIKGKYYKTTVKVAVKA